MPCVFVRLNLLGQIFDLSLRFGHFRLLVQSCYLPERVSHINEHVDPKHGGLAEYLSYKVRMDE